jgi:MFS family permease
MTISKESGVAPAEAADAPSRPLLRSHRGFQLQFAADTVSKFGSQVTTIALPLVALTVLHASAFQVGLLTAASTVAIVLIGLPAGVWVERVRRRPVMVAADLFRFGLMGSVPVAAAFHLLTLLQLYLVALLAGAATVMFDVAHMSYLPFLIGRDRLAEGNGAAQTSNQGAYFGGPAVCGWLVQLAGAAGAVALDAASFLISACCIGAIRQREPRPPAARGRSLRHEIGVGLSYVYSQPVLRRLVVSGVMLCLATTGLLAVQPVLLVHDLRLSPGVYGLVLAVDAVGGITGGLCAARVTRRLGTTRAIWVPSLLILPFVALIPFTNHGWLIILYPTGTCAYSFGISIRNVAQLSYRQRTCPPELLARMNASMRFLTWSAMPLGALLGGALAEWVGIRAALGAGVALIVLSALPVITNTVRHPAQEPDPV